MNSIRPQIVRDLVRRILADITSKIPDLSETFLIRDGHYCGYRFWDATMTAVWFAEEAEIKFYDEGGKTIRVVDLDTYDTTLEQAA